MSSSSQSGTDLYSTTSRFSKAVTATASALISESANDALLSSSSYKKAIHDSLNSKNSLQLSKRRNDTADLFNNRYTNSSTEYYKQAFKTSKAAYKLLTHIPDELLDDIPEEKTTSSFTLFQGFNASLPAVDEEIELNKSLSDGDLFVKKLTESQEQGKNEDDDDQFKFKLPNGITPDKINESYSTDKLSFYKEQVSNNLDLLEIRKNLAASEIMEIDNKISKLQELRKLVFKRVAKFEQNELFLEHHLEDINDRIQMIKDYNMENIDENEKNEANNKETDEAQEDDENLDDVPLLSKSIYSKLQQRPPNSSSKPSKFKRKSRSSRKTTPTLQQYYEPGSAIRTIRAHEESISTFDFDIPFGTMVTASLDNTVKVWDLSRGKCHGLLEGHIAPVTSMQMDDTIVVTGSLDATLKLWDLTKLEFGASEESPLIHSFESHIDEITALSFHNYNMVSGSQDRTIRQWDLQTGHCLQTIDILWASQMNSLSSLDQSMYVDKVNPFIGALQTYDAALATGTSDGTVRLWDLRSGEVVRTLIGHTGPVTTLQFDDKHLATGSLDRSIRIWDLRTGGIHDAFAYESPISSLQFDHRRIVSSNNENTVKIYDRFEEKHSSCGGQHDDDQIINYVRYKEGYLVEGRTDGNIGIWAI
jgi:division protein 1